MSVDELKNFLKSPDWKTKEEELKKYCDDLDNTVPSLFKCTKQDIIKEHFKNLSKKEEESKKNDEQQQILH
jgi:hypothetical protein